ncbi:Shikimate dehydrogenase (NADP(+)) [Methanocorpusculaceae archaeon Sp1]|nr:Shikimate dehydrogenase (NADP(+)) [Methanocorpusculaceae archaeon Sp1]
MTRICAVIAAASTDVAKTMAANAVAKGAEALEFRLDALANIPKDLSFVSGETLSIATLRSEKDAERKDIFSRALACGATYVDIESDSVLRNEFPKDRVICSYHDFEKTPAAFEILKIFKDLENSGIPKAAFMVQGPSDLLEIWKASLVLRQTGRPFILIGMGAAGEVTRVRAAEIGSMLTYCAVTPELASAPGQITVDDAVRLGENPIVTAITGWPLTHTRSPKMHNAAFLDAGINGRYVKIPSSTDELPLIPEVIRCYNITGMNVTIPHKQSVIPLLAKVAETARSAGAVNTICNSDGKLSGANTDIAGIKATIATLGINPCGAKILIIGAGGAARAAAACLSGTCAQLSITNRTREKAEALAEEFGGAAADLDSLAPEYDLIINATPAGMSGFSDSLPVPASILTPTTAVFDMVYEPENTVLLAAARDRGVRKTAGGKQMLIEQAKASFALWTGTIPDTAVMTKAFEEQP